MRGGHPGSLQQIASQEAEKPKNQSATTQRLLEYIGPYKREAILMILITLIGAAAQAFWPAWMGISIDRYVKPGGDSQGLLVSMLILLVIFVISFVASRYQIVLMGAVTQKTLFDIRKSVFEKVQKLPISFFDKNPVGDLMSRLVNDTDTINQFLGQGVVQVIGGIFALIGVIIAMLIQNWFLALVSFTVIPLMFIMTNIFSGLARNAYRRTRRTIGDVSANLQEEIAGVKVAQAFNQTEAVQQRFAQRNAANRSANMSATAVTSAFTPLIDFLSTVATAIVAGVGGYMVVQGQMSIGIVVAFLAYVTTLFRPLQQLSTIYTQAQSALAGAERIFDLVDGPNEEDNCPDCDLPAIAGNVEFQEVSFAYDPAKPVLKHVSFAANAGSTVAIVGPTGAGKTTIINLLSRYYNPTSGTILVDGHNIADYTRASLRRQMGSVPQDSFLFAGTIADNIRYGKLSATDAEVEAAAQAANAHEFISRLKDGYQTKLGERGAGLSQGQRQLIGIARAILADPRILILDEATSSVDTYTESLIQKALAKLLKGRTSFVIAHRLSTIRDADMVLVVENGEIVERGKHDELLARHGLYAELYQRQFRKVE